MLRKWLVAGHAHVRFSAIADEKQSAAQDLMEEVQKRSSFTGNDVMVLDNIREGAKHCIHAGHTLAVANHNPSQAATLQAIANPLNTLICHT